jgi:hypothetical protein
MRQILRARQGVVTRLFPHNANRQALKTARALLVAPSGLSPAAGALAGASVGVAYTPIQFTVAAGGLPVHFVIASGFYQGIGTDFNALPRGLTITDAGLLSGTPAALTAGTYNFTVRAFNMSGAVQANYSMVIT